MNQLRLLPLDISTTCLLPYIPPEDFDAFCGSSTDFESWSLIPKNIQHYLSLRNVSLSPNKGLIWAIEHKSKVLREYFLSRGAKNFDTAATVAVTTGQFDILEQLLESWSQRL